MLTVKIGVEHRIRCANPQSVLHVVGTIRPDLGVTPPVYGAIDARGVLTVGEKRATVEVQAAKEVS